MAGKSSKSPWPLIRKLHEERLAPGPAKVVSYSWGTRTAYPVLSSVDVRAGCS
jgi:hypothetical protein